MITKAGSFLVLFTFFLLSLGQTAVTAVAFDSAICKPALFGSDNSLFIDRYPVADEAFDKQHYRFAFRAYYQYFFCQIGMGGLNAAAEDSGAAEQLRLAISAAADGRYPLALTKAMLALKVDPRLGEAQFIIGDIDWVLRRRTAAHMYWDAAAQNPGYPEPPHDLTRESPLSLAARRMLRIHH